jgi:hypothetical protein
LCAGRGTSEAPTEKKKERMDLLTVIGNANGNVEEIQSLIRWELGGQKLDEEEFDLQDLILRNTDEVDVYITLPSVSLSHTSLYIFSLSL